MNPHGMHPPSPLPLHPAPSTLVAAVGDAAVSTARWRVLLIDNQPIALIKRIFVLPICRRRRIARMMLLNILYDIVMQAASRHIPFQRVSVIIPAETRLSKVGALLQGLGFQLVNTSIEDPSGMWGKVEGRNLFEFSLLFPSIMPLLQTANGEAVRPAQWSQS